jgi:hypothetical protein
MHILFGVFTTYLLLVDPAVLAGGPVSDSLGEPEGDLLGGGLGRIGTVAEVSADIEAIVTTDGTRGRLGRASGSQELASFREGVESLEYHGDNGAREHVVDETSEEWLSLQVSVVVFHVLTSRSSHLQANELETLLLESK